MQFSTSITIDGVTVIASVPRGTKAWRRANSIFCPLGPAHSQGWFVMLKRDLDSIDPNGAHSIVWTQQNADDASPPNVTTSTLTFRGFYIVSAERVQHGGPDDPNALYLVELADGRYLASKKSDSGDLRMNLRSYANPAIYLAGTGTKTWDNLVATLWTRCPQLGNYPGLPGTLPLDGDPDGAWLVGLNSYRALCAVLDQLDCAIAPDPLDSNNLFGIVQLGGDQTVPDNNSTLQWDAQPLSVNATQAAAVLDVWFHKQLRGFGQERDTDLDHNWAFDGSNYNVTNDTDISGAEGTLPVWDDLPLVIGENGLPENGNEVIIRATVRKSRYVDRMTVTNRHRIHFGLLSDFLPGGKIRAVIWRNFDDGDHNPLGGPVTEYICCPQLIGGFKTGDHLPVWFDKQLVTPADEAYAPPDLARRSYPNYPRIASIVQVSNLDAQPGQTVKPNVDGLHRGLVARWSAGAMFTSVDACWILFVDDYDNAIGQLNVKNGDYFGPARLSGVKTSQAIQRPLYLVRKGADTDADVVFQLGVDLALGGQALAVVCNLDAAGVYQPTGSVIVVVDFNKGDATLTAGSGLWAGKAGYRGIARKRTDLENDTFPKYDIVHMERPALIVEFTATEDRDPQADSFLASITTFNQHGDRDPPNQIPADSQNPVRIAIYDDEKRFPHILKGGTGKAIWNDRAGVYECVTAQQVCLLAFAQINEAVTGLDGEDRDYAINNFQPITPSPFNLVPDPPPSQAFNVFELRCKDGDYVLVTMEFVEGSGITWQIIQVPNREKGDIVKPVDNIEKGQSGVCNYVDDDGNPTGKQAMFKADYAKVLAGKGCSTWTTPTTGVKHVAPWE